MLIDYISNPYSPSSYNHNNINYARQTNSRTAPQVHGKHQEPKHKAGSAGEEVLVCPWVALPHQCEAVAGHAGHRAEEIPHVHLCERVLLAWA